jgi:hypothetical protein
LALLERPFQCPTLHLALYKGHYLEIIAAGELRTKRAAHQEYIMLTTKPLIVLRLFKRIKGIVYFLKLFVGQHITN